MNKYCIIIIAVIAAFAINACNKFPVEEKIVYVPVADSTIIKEAAYYKQQYELMRDSITIVKDSIGEDLFIAKYKLARIKYYTDIVNNKPSQLKFYKGWINRVLNE